MMSFYSRGTSLLNENWVGAMNPNVNITAYGICIDRLYHYTSYCVFTSISIVVVLEKKFFLTCSLRISMLNFEPRLEPQFWSGGHDFYSLESLLYIHAFA